MSHLRSSLDYRRRRVVKVTALITAMTTFPTRLLAAVTRPVDAFEATDITLAFEHLATGVNASDQIELETPDIAENGAVVPVRVYSRIANTRRIAILVDRNPNPLSAVFDIPVGTVPRVHTRVKMAETSNVYALVEADGKYYSSTRETKVTLGGCGG